MPIHIPTFKTRTITAVLFVAVMLLGLLWNKWSFFLLFSVVHFGCCWEYISLVEKIESTRFPSFSKVGIMMGSYALALSLSAMPQFLLQQDMPIFLFVLALAAFLFLVKDIFFATAIHLPAYARAGVGFVYLSFFTTAIFLLFQPVSIRFAATSFLFAGATLPLLIIICIWINDTMAYLVGSLIGKRSLSPISPKKTWEGTIGGALLATVSVTMLFPLFQKGGYTWPGILFAACLATLICVAGVLGDLLESKWKRMAGVKDSGNFLPGHGGFLDRFDSLLLATCIALIFLKCFS